MAPWRRGILLLFELLLGTPQPSVQQAQQLWQAALSAHASQTNTECLAKQAKDLQTDCKSSASLSLASPSSALPAHRILEQTLSMSVHPEKYLTTHTNCTYIYSHAVETAHGGSVRERPCQPANPIPHRGRARSLAKRIGQEDVNLKSSSETLVAMSPLQPMPTEGIFLKIRKCGRAFRPKVQTQTKVLLNMSKKVGKNRKFSGQRGTNQTTTRHFG